MSLLKEAIEGIRRQRKAEEEARHFAEIAKKIKTEEEKRIEEEKREALQLEVRSKCVELLNQYGSTSLEVLNRHTVWHGWGIDVVLGKKNEELIRIRIQSQSLVPGKGGIAVSVQGIDTFLMLPKKGKGRILGIDSSYDQEANRKTLEEYNAVVGEAGKLEENLISHFLPQKPAKNRG